MVVGLVTAAIAAGALGFLVSDRASTSWGVTLAVAFLLGGVGAVLNALSRLERAEHVQLASGMHGYRLFGFL